MSQPGKKILLISCLLTMAASAFAAGGAGVVTSDPGKHFDAKGKLPSKYTLDP